jgi:hypothetical protein
LGEGAGFPVEEDRLQPREDAGQKGEDQGLDPGGVGRAQLFLHPVAQGGEGVFQRGRLR